MQVITDSVITDMSMKLLICKLCGKQFLPYAPGKSLYCRICNNAWHKEQKQKQEEAEKQKWEELKKRDQEIFENSISNYNLIAIDDIKPSRQTLYILGNGFDLMHRVSSSYYSFRDSLGKNSTLRYMLETALTPDDIWADFEESLGHLNLDLMGSRDIVDMWLDDFGYFDEDAGAAEFYMAVEAAADPAITITNDLRPSFRKWVSKLDVGTDDKPLEGLICPEGQALNFNYTEFAETLYGLKNVCYIHGCRNSKEELILGHRFGIEPHFYQKDRKPRNYHQAVVDLAQENVFDLIGQYDKALTKNSHEIIKGHRAFFDGLLHYEQVVVIGHSLSPVDWDYFSEINKMIPNAQWYFGLFCLNDLRNLNNLSKELELKNYHIFRTDKIWTRPNKDNTIAKPAVINTKPRKYKLGDIVVNISNLYDLTIGKDFEMILPEPVKTVVILTDHIFIVLRDLQKNILLFNRQEYHWSYVAKLESFEHQSLLNRRLNHIYLTETDLTFVYNNRIRSYKLSTGELYRNVQARDAKNLEYEGIDIMKKFSDYHQNTNND